MKHKCKRCKKFRTDDERGYTHCESCHTVYAYKRDYNLKLYKFTNDRFRAFVKEFNFGDADAALQWLMLYVDKEHLKRWAELNQCLDCMEQGVFIMPEFATKRHNRQRGDDEKDA